MFTSQRIALLGLICGTAFLQGCGSEASNAVDPKVGATTVSPAPKAQPVVTTTAPALVPSTAAMTTPSPTPVAPSMTDNKCQVYMFEALLTFSMVDADSFLDRFELEEISCPNDPTRPPLTMIPDFMKTLTSVITKPLMMLDGDSCEDFSSSMEYNIIQSSAFGGKIKSAAQTLAFASCAVAPDVENKPTVGEVCKISVPGIFSKGTDSEDFSLQLINQEDGTWRTEKAWCGANEPTETLTHWREYPEGILIKYFDCNTMQSLWTTAADQANKLYGKVGSKFATPEQACEAVAFFHGDVAFDLAKFLHFDKLPKIIRSFFVEKADQLENMALNVIGKVMGWKTSAGVQTFLKMDQTLLRM